MKKASEVMAQSKEGQCIHYVTSRKKKKGREIKGYKVYLKKLYS